jgi:chromosome segregation ATPase
MDAAEQALAAARQGATSELDALAGEAGTVRTSVTGLLEHVREQLTALQLQQARLDEAASGRLSGVQEDVNELAEKVQAGQQAVAAELKQAGEAVDRLQDAVHTAHDSLVSQQGELDGVLEALETSATQKASEWVGGIQSLLAAQTTAMVDLANRAIAGHNNTMETLRNAFAVEARDAVTASFAPLQDGLDRLARAAGRQQGLLSAKAQEAVTRVRGIAPVLDALRASFEQSRRLA